jgi:diacylglycerol kinase (ATP)
MSSKAGSMDADVERKLRKAFADFTILEFDPDEDLSQLMSPQARLVVAGGDGTVEFMVRKFADTQHPIGIVPLGTYNNLAHALGLADDLDRAIEVAREGRARPITLGRINDHIFVEACAIGLLGETIVLGDAAKDHAFGQLNDHLKSVLSAKRFRYEISGDFEGKGAAMSLVFSNTGSIGSQLQIADTSPIHPYLEFSVQAGSTRLDIARRALMAAVLRKHQPTPSAEQVIKFNKLVVKTTPRVRVYADNFQVGRTPATVVAETSALKMLLPA